MEDEGTEFTLIELVNASGWKESTAKANAAKKLASLLSKTDNGFRSHGVKRLNEESFCRLCSQKSALALNPRKPSLAPKVEGYVNKAREAALSAVQNYNNPTSQFRSANYIVMMVIAFTSLFHATFERDGVDYVERDKDGNPIVRGGNQMLWDGLHSAKYYASSCDLPLVKNLELLIAIRNKIEHQYMPQLDTDIHGHCQALLMNFEQILVREFTDFYALNTSLAMAIQFSTQRAPETVDTLRRFQSAEYDAVKQYISNYEGNLSDEVRSDPQFAFRVWLIPKTVNNIKQSDISIEFVRPSEIPPELLDTLAKCLIAEKQIIREARNTKGFRPKDVSSRVEAAIGKKFSHSSHHYRASIIHKIRPDKNAVDPAKTNTRYCYWDTTFEQYIYTEDWIQFLIEEYSDEAKYTKAFSKKEV